VSYPVVLEEGGGSTMNLVNLVPSSTVVGTLKGYDQLLNLVMDDLEETLRGENPLLANPVYVFSLLKFFPMSSQIQKLDYLRLHRKRGLWDSQFYEEQAWSS